MSSERSILMRPGREDDLDVLAELWRESASLPGVGPANIPPLSELRDRMIREVEDGWLITVALLDEKIAGFLAVKPAIALLDQLFVRPQLLGRGIGGALFQQATFLMPGGFTLHTASTNIRARAFYQDAKMVLFKEEAHPRFGHPIAWYRWPGTQPSAASKPVENRSRRSSRFF